MSNAGFTQMGAMPAAAGARACGRPSSYLAWAIADAAVDAKQKGFATFVDVPLTHRHRRPWGTP